MIRLNIHEAKTHLSRYLDELAKGEIIILCKRNIPIAEIRPIHPQRKDHRPVGLARGEFEVTFSGKVGAVHMIIWFPEYGVVLIGILIGGEHTT